MAHMGIGCPEWKVRTIVKYLAALSASWLPASSRSPPFPETVRSGQEHEETCAISVTYSGSHYGKYFLRNVPEAILYTFGGEPGKVPIHI